MGRADGDDGAEAVEPEEGAEGPPGEGLAAAAEGEVRGVALVRLAVRPPDSRGWWWGVKRV